jgi:hypothetical protein
LDLELDRSTENCDSNAIYIVILFGKGSTTKTTQSKSLQLYYRNSMQKFWQKLKQKQFSI